MSTHSELIALYREGILSGEDLRRSLAALNTVIEQQAAAPAPQATPAPPIAPAEPAPGTGKNARKNAKKRAAKKAGKAAPVASGTALAPPASSRPPP